MIGKKVFLRAVEVSDVEILYSFENEMSIWNVSDTVVPFSHFAIEQYVIESASQDIYTSKQLRLMICEINDKKVVGAIDLYDFNPIHQRAGIGILVHSDCRKKGYASEALKLVIDYAFSMLHLHQLYCSINPDNLASIKLFEKHKFIQNGTHKDWQHLNDKWSDVLFFQLIK
jgi:diamine N-acetyltransferase